MADVPEISDSGSTGEQKSAAPAEPVMEITGPFQRDSSEISGLAASRPRLFGGDVNAALIRDMHTERHYARADARDLRAQLDQAMNQVADLQVENAVLKERSGEGHKVHHLQNFLIVVGTALIGLMIELLHFHDLKAVSYLLGLLGAVLLLIGWFLPNLGRRKE